MADVKIVDIDNVQWNMKDQEARNKITNLEQKTQENTEIIQGLNKNVGAGFVAKASARNIIMYPYETCFISGFIQNVGPYMAILSANSPDSLAIQDLFGSASNYINIKAMGNFQYELTLNGPMSLFGFAKSVS